jgi:hypothetical protein
MFIAVDWDELLLIAFGAEIPSEFSSPFPTHFLVGVTLRFEMTERPMLYSEFNFVVSIMLSDLM